MKYIHLAIVLVTTLFLGISAQAQDYIIQTELDPSYDPPISAQIDIQGPVSTGTVTGATDAAFAISEFGSRFDLYTVIETASGNKVYHLATVVVGPYPTCTIDVTTKDTSTTYEHRSRADQRFGIDVTVAGTSDDPEAPESMRKVWVKHILKEYPDGEFTFPATENTSTWRSAKTNNSGAEAGIFITSDQTYSVKTPAISDGMNTALTSLQSTDAEDTNNIFATGEERVEIYVKPPSSDTWHMIMEKTVRVLPQHFAKIVASSDSFENTSFELSPVGSQKEYSYVPQIAAQCTDIYPSSITTFSLYKGTHTNQGELVAGVGTSLLLDDLIRQTSPIALNETDPQSFTLILPEASINALNNNQGITDGPYTVVLEIQTTFAENTYVVYSDFLLKRSIRVNANISTQN